MAAGTGHNSASAPVVNTATGAVAQRLDYDEFGFITLEYARQSY